MLDVFVNTYEEYNQPRRTATTAIHPECDDTLNGKPITYRICPTIISPRIEVERFGKTSIETFLILSVNIFLGAMIRKHTICIAHHSSYF